MENKMIDIKEDEIDTFSSDSIICPYCGNEIDIDCETFESRELEFEEEMKCWECGKTFIAQQSVSFSYETFKKESEEDNGK